MIEEKKAKLIKQLQDTTDEALIDRLMQEIYLIKNVYLDKAACMEIAKGVKQCNGT